MADYYTFDMILQDGEATLENAKAFAIGFDWSECTAQWETIGHARYEDTVNGIEIYYDYGADYYFFCPEEKDKP